MMYSLDYRQRMMKVKAREGLTDLETRQRFGVGMRTLFKWNKKIEPQRQRNKPATKNRPGSATAVCSQLSSPVSVRTRTDVWCQYHGYFLCAEKTRDQL
jgi:transposase